jgi:ATP-dependent Clp protease ATP-binding subunit ClpC
MFERFTSQARRAVVLAQEEAASLDHNYIGTEHLLLGLLHEGNGAAARALASADIALTPAQGEVEVIIGRGQQAPSGRRSAWRCRCGSPWRWATTTSAQGISCSG